MRMVSCQLLDVCIQAVWSVKHGLLSLFGGYGRIIAHVYADSENVSSELCCNGKINDKIFIPWWGKSPHLLTSNEAELSADAGFSIHNIEGFFVPYRLQSG
jgi:hypothetical protein